MTVLSCGQDGDPPMDAQEVTRCLKRELGLREGANAVGSPCSPAKASALLQQLQQLPCMSNPSSSSQRHLRGFGRGRGVSSSQSASSDSSGGYLCFSSREVEGGSINSMPNAASARSLFPSAGPTNRIICSRASQPRVIGQAAGQGEPMPSSPIPAATVGRGKNGLSATSVAKAPKPKRKRLSKKTPTTNIEATQAEFRAKVQELTGCPIPIVRPLPQHPQPESSQPERPRAAAVPINVDMVANPPARPDCSSTSTISVPSPSPTVSNRIPEATYSFRDSSGSSCRSSLNYCMGYEQAPFLFDVDQEDLGIADEVFKPTSASSYGHHRETTKEPSSEVVTKAAPLVSGIVDKRDNIIPRERMFPGAAALLEDDFDFRPFPGEVLPFPYRRPRDTEDDIGLPLDLRFDDTFPSAGDWLSHM